MKQNFSLVLQPDKIDDSQSVKQLKTAFEGFKVSNNETTKSEEIKENKEVETV